MQRWWSTTFAHFTGAAASEGAGVGSGMGAGARGLAGPASVVEHELPALAVEPAARLGLEDRAVIHLAAVDMERHRQAVGPGVGEHVIVEGRDERPGRARGGAHRAAMLEAAAAGGLLLEVVARHLHLSLHHPFDAPDAGVVVERRRL